MRKQWVLVGILAAMPIAAGEALAQHKAPRQQPTTTESPDIEAKPVPLGTVRIGRQVLADGKPLPAGTYQVRVTEQVAKPDAVGAAEVLERWAEFVQGKEVRGREVVSIVPESEVKAVVKDTPPRPGGSKVQMLRGNEYLRVWVNRGGTHYLIHLPTGMTEAGTTR